jgi:hypothetical protein
MYIRWHRSKRANGVVVGCGGASWRGSPLQLGGGPTEFIFGRVRPDVATVELRFADGARVPVSPKSGFVLYAVARPHVLEGHQLVGATARNAAGRTIGTQSFRPPGKRR